MWNVKLFSRYNLSSPKSSLTVQRLTRFPPARSPFNVQHFIVGPFIGFIYGEQLIKTDTKMETTKNRFAFPGIFFLFLQCLHEQWGRFTIAL